MNNVLSPGHRFAAAAGFSALARCALGRGGTVAAAFVLIAMAGRMSPAQAQQFPAFGGVGVRVGAAWPQDANVGLEWSADADLGYLKSPRLRVLFGLTGFSADVDRMAGGTPIDGSLSAFGGHGSLRFDPLGTGRFTPYLTVGLRATNVSADVADEATQDLLDGFYAGAGVGAGMTYALDAAGRFAATAETRRVWMNNVGHWALEAGIRVLPRGGGTYTRATSDPADEARRVVEAGREQRARIEMERRLSDSLAAAQRESIELARTAAERQRASERENEAQRARTLREAERRAEEARADSQLARMRERGDSLEVARRAEADRRVRAEAEADDARRRAAASDSARRAAERSAAEAERQRYQALLDLHRLITNVTEIRESDRGLVVVLGQGLFASGQYRLSPRARDEVGTIAAVLSQYRDHWIVVEGHTDAVGGELANQRLSEQRADAARAALIAMGVDPSRVRAVGFGEGRPTADNAAAAGRAANRRVEIVIEGARPPASAGSR